MISVIFVATRPLPLVWVSVFGIRASGGNGALLHGVHA